MIYCARSSRRCSSVPAGETCGHYQGQSGGRSARPLLKRNLGITPPTLSLSKALGAGFLRFAITSTATPTAPSTRFALRTCCTSSMCSTRNPPRGSLPQSDTSIWSDSACATLRPFTEQPRKPDYEQEDLAHPRGRKWQYLC